MTGFPFALWTSAIVLSSALLTSRGAEAPSAPDWKITGVRIQFSDGLSEFRFGAEQLQLRPAPEGTLFVEAQALFASDSGNIGPIGVADIKLKVTAKAANGPAPAPYPLAAVGTLNKGCTYVDFSETPADRGTTVEMTSGAQLSLSRSASTDVQFGVKAKQIPLCLAFAVPNSVLGEPPLALDRVELLVQRELTAGLAVGQRTSPRGWLAAAALALVLAGVYLARRRWFAAWEEAGTRLRGGGADYAAPRIAPLGDADLPGAVSTLDEPAGPGTATLAAATLAMQGEDFDTVDRYLRQALELGLSSKQRGEARLMLAEAALQRGDLVGAIQEYRCCLQGERVALWPALNAATHLVEIYQKLGMSASARKAGSVITLAPPASWDLLQPSRVQQIAQLAKALKRSMGRSSWRNGWGTGLVFLRAVLRSPPGK